MTESKSDTPAAKAAAPANKPAAQQAGSPKSAKTNAAGPSRGKRKGWIAAFVIVLVVAVALAAALWYQNQRFKAATAALAGQVQDSAASARQASQQAQQALSTARQQADRLEAMQASLEKSQEHIHTLDQALQSLTDSGSDVALINDIDHIVTIANQQLTLNGNVSNAIVALESAQARLARANRPGLASLQQTINGDLDKLRAASVVDVASVASQLNKLGDLVSRASLLVPDDAALSVQSSGQADATRDAAPDSRQPAPDPSLPGWRRALGDVGDWLGNAWGSVRQELHRLVSIRRVADPAALLMSPDQARQLRENLRLRIMTAQLALMMHQNSIWETETQAVVQALHTRYDSQDPRTRRALKLATDLAQTRIDVELPTLDNSISALHALREAEMQAEQSTGQQSPADSAGDQQAAPPASEPAGAGPSQE